MPNVTDNEYSRFTQRIIFATEGLVLFISNGLIVLVVLRFKQLRQRKEFFIMMGAALADMNVGLAYFIAGIRRIYLVKSGQAQVLVSSLYCFLMPYNIFWLAAEPAALFMSVAISFDRLFAVVLPLKYLNQQIRYGHTVVGVAYCLALLHFVGALISCLSQQSKPIHPIICHMTSSVSKGFALYHYFLLLLSSIVSLLLYGMVPFIYKIKKAKVQPNGISAQNRNDLKFQKRMMKTMGINTAFTGVCYTIPIMATVLILSYYMSNGIHPPKFIEYILIPMFNVLQQIDPMANLAIYVTRHEEFCNAVSHFFRCKELPVNFEAYKRARRHHPSVVRVRTKVPKEIEMGSKVPEDIGMGSKVTEDIGMGSKVTEDIGMGSKVPKEIEMGSKVPEDIGMGSKVSENIGMGSKITEDIGVGSKVPKEIEMGSKVTEDIGMGSKVTEDIGMGSKVPEDLGMGSKVPEDMESC